MVFVFAYGSNLSPQRMHCRVSTTQVVSVGYVRQRRFAFHKRSVDGSAKADAALTAMPDDRVWGVVYQLDAQQKMVLDQYESLGVGYDEVLVEVVNEGSAMRAWMYVARDNAIDASLLPYCWYHDLVIDGARQHQLPESYVEFLRSFDSVIDTNAERKAENRSLLQ